MKCPQCGTDRRSLHRDHIIPKWRGGSDTEENIQLICANCHEDKTWNEQRSPEWTVRLSAWLMGHQVSPETKAKISASHKGKKLSEEHKKKISDTTIGRIGRSHTAETRAKLSAINMGKVMGPLSDEHKEAISAGLKAYHAGKKHDTGR